MRSLRAVIVDDERLSRRAMRQLLDARGDVEVVAEFEDALSAEVCLARTSVDVVFLDVQMPHRSGLDLARDRQRAGPPFVVFVTAYDEYALPAFETEAVDYLSKPVAPDRLSKTITRVRERLSTHADAVRDGEPLVARVGDRDVMLPLVDIEYIEADGVYAGVVVGDRRYLVRSALDALERTLPPAAFMRVHRSWIVPRDRIASIRRTVGGQRELVLTSGVVVPVSRRRQAHVMRALRRGRSSERSERFPGAR